MTPEEIKDTAQRIIRCELMRQLDGLVEGWSVRYRPMLADPAFEISTINPNTRASLVVDHDAVEVLGDLAIEYITLQAEDMALELRDVVLMNTKDNA